jgi:hypothetical protein
MDSSERSDADSAAATSAAIRRLTPPIDFSLVLAGIVGQVVSVKSFGVVYVG